MRQSTALRRYAGGLAARPVRSLFVGVVRIVGELEQRGVGFLSLTEYIETGNAAGKLIFMCSPRLPSLNVT